ncbi:unnamed protein product [Blepharisma stoltei]|uniref:GAR domain-containing protein n=1 Tax=Blepharisma stoltei TaxID=1481888 RepID=A0AAU9JF96_9CILI|nr:unnamed protein product [Blepharisma stoltei]
MEIKKSYELQLDLKEVTGLPHGLTCCRVNIENYENILDGLKPLIITLDTISNLTKLSITLLYRNNAIGGCQMSLVTLFGEKLQGKIDKWIKINQEQVKDVKIKLSANLKIKEVEVTPMKSQKNKEPGEFDSKCAYLCALVDNKAESQGDIQKIKIDREYPIDERENELIRITLDSEPQNRFVAEQSLSLYPGLEELNLEKLIESGPTQMRKLIKILGEEIRSKHATSLDLPYVVNKLNTKINERKELEDQTQSAVNTLSGNLEGKSAKLKEIQLQREIIAKELLEEIEKIRKSEWEIEDFIKDVEEIKRQNLAIQAENVRNKDFGKTVKSLQGLVSSYKQRNEELKEKSEKSSANMQTIIENSQKQKNSLSHDIEIAKQELSDTNSQTKSILLQNEQLEKRIAELKQQMSGDRNLKQYLQDSSAISSSKSSIREQAQRDLYQFSSSINSEADHYKQKQKNLFASKKSAAQSLHTAEQEIGLREIQIIELQKNKYMSTNKQIVMEQVCCIRADLGVMTEEVSKLQKNINYIKGSLFRELENGSQYAATESKNILEEANNLESMIDSIDEKDIEIGSLKATMGDVKKRNPIYVPEKDDPIDIALSEFLNTMVDVIPVPFTREDEGIYLFGTKRIFLKLEQGQIVIRVGGGFMGIDEFIEIYTPLELEKQESVLTEAGPAFTKSLSRFLSAPDIGMSPQRASRIIKGTVEAISSGSPLKPIASPLRKVRPILEKARS